MKIKNYICLPIVAVVLLAAVTAAMAMDRTTMLTMFWGNNYVSTLEMVDTLELLDTLEMN